MASDLILSRHPGEGASAWAALLRATDTGDRSAHQRAMLAHAVAFAEGLACVTGDVLQQTVDSRAAGHKGGARITVVCSEGANCPGETGRNCRPCTVQIALPTNS
jgi:hypothetical protein